jgi:hypothetical protein
LPVSISVEFPDENDIQLDPHFVETSSGCVIVKGRGNRIRIGRPLSAGSPTIMVEHGASISIGEGCVLSAVGVFALAPGASIEIGNRVGFVGVSHVTAHETASVKIGDGSLIAGGCSIASSDVHKIFDVETGQRLNVAGDIILEERVWLAASVTVLRNTFIDHDSVVGVGSVVRGAFPPHTLIAGAPAIVGREGIRWEQ